VTDDELSQALKDISPDELHRLIELRKIIDESCDGYHGSLQGIAGAIGILMVGQVYGWRVLRVAVATSTFAKYEKMLGIKLNEYCPERGRLAHRSWGLKLADTVGDFWAAVSGKIPGKRSDKILDASLSVPNSEEVC